MKIENEYGNIEAAFHEKGPPYVAWAAKMAVDLQTGVPWMMCKQDDAPDPVVSPLFFVLFHGLDQQANISTIKRHFYSLISLIQLYFWLVWGFSFMMFFSEVNPLICRSMPAME